MPISVLVVEDQADILERVRVLLEGAGYVVHGARNPDEALDLLNRLPRPCLLLWDAMTPRQSLTMVDRATLEGVHVAALPVSVTAVHLAGSPREVSKRLSSEDAILSIVQEHCPLPEKVSA
jgi:CheY-like chemotaxis protein